MDNHFSIEESVKKRYSVRNYQEQEVEPEKRKKLKTYIKLRDNPFQKKVYFHFLDNSKEWIWELLQLTLIFQ